MKRIGSVSLGLAIAVFVAAGLQVRKTPSFESIQAAHRSSNRLILDRNGQILDEVPGAKRLRGLTWVGLDEVPPGFVTALSLGAGALGLSQLLENPHSGPTRKLAQVWTALGLALTWSRHDRLEAYMNLASYGGELQGISAASFAWFDKSPMALTRSEAARIAALIAAPKDSGAPVHDHVSARLAPQIARRLAMWPEVGQGSMIRSTLDRQIQWLALRALQKQIATLHSQNLKDGAVIVIENATGNVLAYVGASSNVEPIDAGMALRPAGPMLQPLIYGKAIDEKVLTAATELEASPQVTAFTMSGSRPTAFHSPATVRTALVNSLSLPAVETLELLGVDTFVGTMTDLGFTGLRRPELYGPSLALGSVAVRLVELTNAYRTIAQGGRWSPLRFSPDKLSEQGTKRVMSEAAAFIVKDVLTEPGPQTYWSAAKTATSQDRRDNWSVGFAEKYTVGVWVGSFSGGVMWNVSEVQAAALVWRDVMNSLPRIEASHAPIPPEGLVKNQEWFITGTEPAESDAKSGVRSRISYPSNRSSIALDSQNHGLFIQIVAPKDDQNLYLNGQRLGHAKAYQSWEPQAGKYTLELRDSQGRVVDRVRFEVRDRALAAR